MKVKNLLILLKGEHLIRLNGGENFSRADFWHRYRTHAEIWDADICSIKTTVAESGKHQITVIDIATK